MQIRVITAPLDAELPPSPARVHEPELPPLRIGVVQHAWTPDRDALLAWLHAAVDAAAAHGAKAVFLPEIVLSRYPADTLPETAPGDTAEDLETGPTVTFAREAAQRNGVFVHASLYRRAAAEDGLGLNTAVLIAPSGELVGATNKLHIPVTAGYYEDKYFRPGPPDTPYPVYAPGGLGGARIGMPTCWDEWFPEVARAYSLGGANIVAYPTAIGSEPDHPDFDTQPLWQQVIVGNGIANGLFMVVPNRTGAETRDDGTPGNTFYGSSFVSDPYGRVLVQAPRDEPCVLVADLDLAQRQDWLDLFPFLRTRRPDTYSTLVAPVDAEHPYGRER
ncbi:MAG: nitrilase-related carbon-nitrogen hydrolase [Jatrophihabitans sp.]|uniref:nitrilase-related carbon-nitrogen hydrolase n=1 Tax=Jatrophihabitans sp. TaxID=1932789 RepID=UPI003F812B75